MHAHAENRDGVLWKGAGVSSVGTDNVGKHNGRIAESEVVNEAHKEDVLVEHVVVQGVTATYDGAKPQDLRLRAQSKDEEEQVALGGAEPEDRRLRAQSEGRDDQVEHDGAKPQDLHSRAQSNGREVFWSSHRSAT